jgi:hypothetical protein
VNSVEEDMGSYSKKIENKGYSKSEQLMHNFILQYLIVCANPMDTSLIIDINSEEYSVI